MKLKVEMVPKPIYGQNLRSAMPKSRWLKLRGLLIDEFGPTCHTCGADMPDRAKIGAHEEWSYDISGDPALATVTAINLSCFHCHAVEHFGHSLMMVKEGHWTDPGFIPALIAHFCVVNDCGAGDFDDHLGEAEEEWAERSKHKEWVVDFGPFKAVVDGEKPDAFVARHYRGERPPEPFTL